MSSICNKDCLNCVFYDCINDTLTAADYRAARELDEFIRPKTRKEKQIAAKKREYREANREQIAAYQREYREANREQIAAKQREYYEANREQIAAKQREYYEANREQIAAKQKCIAALRRKKGYTQRDVAKLIGVSRQLFALWEQGRSHAHWDKLAAIFPELEGVDT